MEVSVNCQTWNSCTELKQMIDEKKLKEIELRVKKQLEEEVILTKQHIEFVDFFLSNSIKSLKSANVLYDISVQKELQQYLGLTDFDGFLWVVNASYYSMFYMARALLENEGIKIKSDMSIHSSTFDAMIYFFYMNGKLEKRMIQDFADGLHEANILLEKKKIDSLMEEYYFEKSKRATFTYKTSEILLQNKAKTSLERAIRFTQEIRKILIS